MTRCSLTNINMKRFLLFLFLFSGARLGVHAQSISGKVTSAEDGAPLAGVSVAIKNAGSGTTTDAAGSYRLTVGKGATLVFSYVGFESKTVTVGDQPVIDVVLTPGAGLLKDVVVIAYGTVPTCSATCGTVISWSPSRPMIVT